MLAISERSRVVYRRLRLRGPGHVSCHCREPNHDCHYIIPPFRSRPPGLPHTSIYNKKNPIKETKPLRTPPHDLIIPPTDQCPMSSLTADSVRGETATSLDLSPEVVKTRADAICTGPRLVLATVLDHHFGSGSGSEPNQRQIGCPGCQ